MPDEHIESQNPENSEVSSDNTSDTQSNDKKPDSQSKDFLGKLREYRKGKSRARSLYMLDVVCLIAIIIFASNFKTKHYVGQRTPLLYYYEDAEVIDVKKFTNDEDQTMWKVIISYEGADGLSDVATKILYFKKRPKYEVGDIVTLKIQTLYPDNIEVVE